MLTPVYTSNSTEIAARYDGEEVVIERSDSKESIQIVLSPEEIEGIYRMIQECEQEIKNIA